ncbi:MAG: CpsD/CapB family tyrosine-protein kinase [Bacillota bacterium]|jgi:capsular exopolysaccharide synthesis family protein|nr:CpsD/CapB family tyrosine-protein kinase [Bacillota bacterium]
MAKNNGLQPRERDPASRQKIELANRNIEQVREYFNSARINIDYSIIKYDGTGKTFIVTSGLQGEGKTFCSVNLARSFGSIHENKVIILGCDLHAPKLHRYLNIPNKPGLTDFLSNKNTFSESCIYNQKENFYVMPSGTRVPNPSVFLSGKLFQSFLKKLGEQFDYIIIDTPPVLQITDASSFATHTDGVVIVARASQSTKPALKLTIETLEKAQATILGVILNDVDFTKQDYGYGYAYNYRYGE